MIAIVAGILLPVLIVASIGYGWSKLGFPLDRDFVTRLVINVATPCLVIDSIAKLELPVADLLVDGFYRFVDFPTRIDSLIGVALFTFDANAFEIEILTLPIHAGFFQHLDVGLCKSKLFS